MVRSPNAAQLALTVIGAIISSSRMAIDSKTHMDESVRRLQEAFDCCEKLVRTPLPLSYSRWALGVWVWFGCDLGAGQGCALREGLGSRWRFVVGRGQGG